MARETLRSAVTGTSVTTTSEDAPAKTIAHLLTSPKIKEQMALALPKHMTSDRLARIALTEVRKNPKLGQCDQASFLGAIMQLASLGLEPGGALGHAYLIPFDKNSKDANGNWSKKTEVQLIVGYRGMIDLARRSGQIVSLSARIVYENDTFNYTYGLDETMEHIPHEGADPGEMTHTYAVAKLVGGGVQFEVMSRAKIERIRDESQGYKAALANAEKYKKPVESPWTNHFDEMAKKTVIRQLFKYLPVSIEIQRAVGLDEQADAGLNQHNAMVLDGEYQVEQQHDEPAVEQQQESHPTKLTAQLVHDAITAAEDLTSLAEADAMITDLPKKDQDALRGLVVAMRGKLKPAE